MELAIVGLGRMGADMTRRLMQGGHAPVVTDRQTDDESACKVRS